MIHAISVLACAFGQTVWLTNWLFKWSNNQVLNLPSADEVTSVWHFAYTIQGIRAGVAQCV